MVPIIFLTLFVLLGFFAQWVIRRRRRTTGPAFSDMSRDEQVAYMNAVRGGQAAGSHSIAKGMGRTTHGRNNAGFW